MEVSGTWWLKDKTVMESALPLLANVFYFIVIALHLYFAALETFLWRKRAGKVFRLSQDKVEILSGMASNQGVYNLFLVVALGIGFFANHPEVAHVFKIYGLLCVIAAGIWGGLTISKRITIVQAVPATIALVLYVL